MRAAVEDAKELLSDCGIDLDVTAEDLIQWFDTELPSPDIELGEVVVDPLLVVHELVEIDEVLKMGLETTKDVIMKNREKVDDAHIKATKVELMVAKSVGAVDHLESMARAIEGWCKEETLSDRRRAEYRDLLEETKASLGRLVNSSS